MLVKYLPILITGASFFIAIAIHWVYKKSLLFPSLIAALCTAVVSAIGFKFITLPGAATTSSGKNLPLDAVVFAFGSGFVLAVLVGYLMKYAPNFLGK